MRIIVVASLFALAVSLPAQQPTPATPAPMTEMQKADATRCERVRAAGGVCDLDARLKAIQATEDTYEKQMADLDARDEAAAEVFAAQVQAFRDNERHCLLSLHAGNSVKRVRACGEPDSIHGDMSGEQQWVYSEIEMYVYIKHGVVHNLQY